MLYALIAKYSPCITSRPTHPRYEDKPSYMTVKYFLSNYYVVPMLPVPSGQQGYNVHDLPTKNLVCQPLTTNGKKSAPSTEHRLRSHCQTRP